MYIVCFYKERFCCFLTFSFSIIFIYIAPVLSVISWCIFSVSDGEMCVVVLDQGMVKQLYVPIFREVHKRTSCTFN